MLRLVIPEELRGCSMASLGLSTHALNRLLSARLRTLGDVHGLTDYQLAALPGVGRTALREILDGINRTIAEGCPNAEIPSAEGMASAGKAIAIPPALCAWPISVLSLSAATTAALESNGVRELGHLADRAPEELEGLVGVGPRRSSEIVSALEDLAALPDASVFRKDRKGAPLPPGAPLGLFRNVADAGNPSREIEALVADLTKRNRELLLQRWERIEGRQTRLEEIASAHGLTRERVRQIVEKHERLLADSNLWLPRTAKIAEVLEASGGTLSDAELRRGCVSEGCEIQQHDLNVLESLGALGLVPRVQYDAKVKLWLTPTAAKKWARDGSMNALLLLSARQVNADLHILGCVSLTQAPTPFGPERLLELDKLPPVRREGDYLILQNSTGTRLTQFVAQMLAVASPMSVSEIAAGLSRAKVVRRKHRTALDVPPLSVLLQVISSDSRFTVSGDDVSLRNTLRVEDVLSRAEQIVLTAIADRENAATWTQIHQAGEAAGCPDATISLAISQPFVQRLAGGVYGLRGRKVTAQSLRQRKRERREAARENIRRFTMSGTRAKVVYAMSPFSLTGALPLPYRLSKLASRTWIGYLPNGTTKELRAKHGFLWSLRSWLRQEKLKTGDLLIARFSIDEGVVHFELP